MANIHTIGRSTDFPEGKGKAVVVDGKSLAVYRHNGVLGCIGNTCLHAGGSLGEGEVRDGRVYCPWHHWDYDFQSGVGFGEESVGGYKIWEEGDTVSVDLDAPISKKKIAPAHDTLVIQQQRRTDNTIRVLGISCTMMEQKHPRPSTSEYVLEQALHQLDHTNTQGNVKKDNSRSKKQKGELTDNTIETRILKLRDLKFSECEGYYSKDKGACIWPCSITQARKDDEMIEVYRGLVEWCDVVIVATPIRWNSASSLYYKMQERLNCLQNQITLHDKVLIHDKVAGFIITGGQDGVQHVAGQMMMFFSEIGFTFAQFPFVGWSRGWYNEEMKTNFTDVEHSDLTDEAAAMAQRAVEQVRLYRAGQSHSTHKHHK